MIEQYVALDLETSGLNPSADRIIEIGMIKVVDGEITDKYSTIVNPGITLDKRVVELTGITQDMFKGKPYIENIITDILEFIGNMPILGHNIIFDYSFLKKAAVNSNLMLEKEGIDTLKMARRILPEVPHKNLDYLCEHFNIDPGNSHRALDDAISAMKIYKAMHKIKPEDSGFWKADRLVYSVKKDSPITVAQKRYLISLLEFHGIMLDEDIDKMTKSTASRKIDKLISEYGKIILS